jgi:predicted DNA-binding transcriptional regulator YafY
MIEYFEGRGEGEMRASRLLSILTTLQARGRVTAQQLAQDCEVSLRTIYRDIDALAAAGIPVYSERGAEGGYRLLDGYRVRLNGLSQREAESLFLGGLAGPAASLGLQAVMSTAQTKLIAALPQDLRARADRMQACFHLDAPAWFGEAEEPAHLRAVAGAVWSENVIEIRYQSWRAEKHRQVAPLGLVLKSGSWYLAGLVNEDVRTYRIARILDCRVLEQRFTRPPNFDLGAYWRANTERLEAELHPNRATVRLSPRGVKLLEALSAPYVKAGMQIAEASDADGWRVATIPVGTSVWHATAELLRLGAEAEVLAPPELRAAMQQAAEALASRYRSSKSVAPAEDGVQRDPWNERAVRGAQGRKN